MLSYIVSLYNSIKTVTERGCPRTATETVTEQGGLRTKGVSTKGAAAKVMKFDSLGKKVRPGTFGDIKICSREYPKSPSVKKHGICSDPINADPICPFPNGDRARTRHRGRARADGFYISARSVSRQTRPLLGSA